MRPPIFLAPRTPPRTSSRTAHHRSPTTPAGVQDTDATASPCMLLAGWRQSSATFPIRTVTDATWRSRADIRYTRGHEQRNTRLLVPRPLRPPRDAVLGRHG